MSLAITTQVQQKNFTYDANRQLIASVNGDGSGILLEYDANGVLTTKSYYHVSSLNTDGTIKPGKTPFKVQTFTYDANGNLISVS